MKALSDKTKRYLKVMAIGVLIDLVCYLIAHYAHLPAWMDANGTAYSAMMLEPTAGLLVAFLVSFFKATFVYTTRDLIAYSLNAAVALIFGIGMRKCGEICLRRLFPMAGLFVVVNSLLGLAVGLWQGGLISGWENYFYQAALGVGMPQFIAQLFGVFVLKTVDALIMVVILFVGYYVTPSTWRNQKNEPLVSWSTPYFHKK